MTASAAERSNNGAVVSLQGEGKKGLIAQAYAEYKESGIEWLGWIPSRWGITKIKFESSVKARVGWQNLRSDEFVDEGPFCVTGTDFVEGRINWSSAYHVSEERYLTDKNIQLMIGDLLITKDGTIGKLAVVDDLPGKACLNSGVFVVRPKGYTYSSNYLFWLLSSSSFSSFIELHSHGSTINHLYQNVFEQFAFPTPSLQEQLAICGFLDRETARIDHLIAEKQNFINLLKEKRQALISHVVTKGLDPQAKMKESGIEWIGEVPERWMKTRLKFNVTKIIDTEHKTIPFVDESAYLVVRTSDIREGELLIAQCRRTDPDSFEEWTRRGVPSAGDIILTREAPAGEACIVPDGLNVCLGQRTVLIRTSQSLLSEYLVLVIYSDITKTFIDNASMGSTVKHLNMADIPNIPLFLPDLETQAAIVEFTKQELGKIDQIRTETLSSIELLNEHRTALISAAVTGKIDVREQ